ncbi:hypothetical protein Trydic_g16183 [Trypoxylus dichotomus]
MNRRPRKLQPLQIAFWNANGLTTKKTELEEFVQRHQLDAVIIGETHLRASNRISLPNFRVYRTDREGAREGGTAILTKSTICCLQSSQKAALGGRPIGNFRHPGSGYPRRRPQRQAPIMELEADERKRHLSTPLRRRPPPAGGRHRRAHDIPT